MKLPAHVKLSDTEVGQNQVDESALLDKSSWHQVLEIRAAAAAQSGEPLSVLFMDVNYFKSINDALGHEAGDEVIADLKKMMGSLAGSLRTKDEHGTRVQDLISVNEATMPESAGVLPVAIDSGHIGGDEFAILCSTDESGTEIIADRLRNVFKKYLEQPGNERLRLLDVGLAIGSATLEDGMSASELLAKADEAMYEDKQSQLPELTPEQEAVLREYLNKLEEYEIRLRDVGKYAAMLARKSDLLAE